MRRNEARRPAPALRLRQADRNGQPYRTFRRIAGDITTDPTGRTDGDVTTWSYDEATGLLARKTYADGTHEDTAYNALNLRSAHRRAGWSPPGGNLERVQHLRLLQRLHARHQYAYNCLNQLTQVTDASGSRTITYSLQRTGHR